jgi:dTDP-4-dehydrorhamnose 3,5-epimerase
MKFSRTAIEGALLIEPERQEDERGFFARVYCEREFAEHGLETRYPQCSVSFNLARGTVRGLHYQAAPHQEAKIVRCTAGAIYDVVADLRRGSRSYGQWAGVELSAASRRMLYVPAGCAHGFQTLEDNCEVFYQISTEHEPAGFRGVRYDAPALAIQWPLPVSVISERDRALPQPLPA